MHTQYRMPSILSNYSQIDPRIKYLIALTTTTVYSVNAGASVSATMTETDFLSNVTTGPNQVLNTIFRDLGKAVYTRNANGEPQNIYRLVQPQLGFITGGIPNNFDVQRYYVRTWTSDSAGPYSVTVSRIG